MAADADDRQPQIAIDDRRADCRLIAHWRRARRGAALPTLTDMSLSAHPKLREASFLLLVGETAADAVVVLCGEAVSFQDLHLALGQPLSAMRKTVVSDALLRLCVEAVAESRPASLAGNYWSQQGELTRYRLGCVPLRADDAPIPPFSYILGCFSRKIVPAG